MKIYALTLLLAASLFAGETGVRQHDGFYLSLNTGLAFGDIVLDMENTFAKRMTFSGTGGQSELSIGGAIKENMILSADLIGRTIVGPDLNLDGATATTSSDLAAVDRTLGMAFTYYLMPSNVFFSGTLGFGSFSLLYNRVAWTSETGLSFQAKAGKEWWVSDNWGLGMSLCYDFVGAVDKMTGSPSGYKGTLSTSKLALLFNTTFN